jgi:hypothetical protein
MKTPETKVQSFDAIIADSNKAIENVENTLQQFTTLISTAEQTVATISNAVVKVKEIEHNIIQLDTQVTLVCKEFDMRIEKCQQHATTIQRVLTSISSNSDAVLEKVLAMDAETADENTIKHRSELIAILHNNTNAISQMFLKFLEV